ncbi:flavin-containing monooxygenase [Stappia indica]|uniref:flavin-containing monooxygenase n=1 Tax=Stappia indica TaxID=538381 RepID=UPI001CD70C04|nr:FAD-dependent oxidoreductase [Stappia indica]MCA1297810.1 FAD-dependent oxidoreductase [Stappia indica]
MVKRKKVCVIGAGVSGLASAHAFNSRGHEVTVLERSHDLGGVWEPSRSYPGIKTQSPKDLYRYVGKAMPADYPEWPSGRQVYEYLRDYAADNGLMPLIRFSHKVTAMERRPDGGWRLAVEAEDGTAQAMEFDFVVVASGTFSDKNEVTHPGRDAFEAAGGKVMHSCEYTDASIVRGRKVVVLGFSKSATDVAVNAVREGASEVSIVYLEPVWRIPYKFGGLVNFKRILYCRASESMFPGWSMTALGRIGHALAKPLIWANWRGLEALLTAQFGLKKLGMRPEKPIEDTISCGLPIATEGFFDFLKQGRIKAYQGTFDHYEGKSVVLTGGQTLDADVVVQAVGWKLGIPFLPEEVRARLIDGDGQYRLYRLIVNPEVPDLGFVGFNSSFATVLTSNMAAEWLVRYVDGQLANQPSPERMRQWIDAHLTWRRTRRPAAKVYGGLCSAPYHFRHLDELIKDMGASKTSRANPLAEVFTPPNADAFGKYLETVPSYQVG